MREWRYSSTILDVGTTQRCGQLHALAALLLGEDPGTHYIGRWVAPRTSLDFVEKRKISIPGRELNPNQPARHYTQ
jgi:hypothetical protein